MRFLVSAGPTREFLDPVRFISNRSTGKMGFAIAAAAAAAGHDVTIVAGPVALATPAGVRRVDVISALEMASKLEEEFPKCDVLVMAAAVADWRPAEIAPQKLKKLTMEPVIKLVRNPDILKTLAPRKGNRIVIGFAAETTLDPEEAMRKLTEKNLDYICANDVTQPGAGFGTDTNIITIFGGAGVVASLPLMDKRDAAAKIVALAEKKRNM